MILLTSITDKIQLITGSAGLVHTHISYADATGSPVSVSLGRINSIITTAATTDICAAPGASTSRNVKQIKISNEHATISNAITLQHTDGSSAIIFEKITLAPGERLGYEEGVGFRVFDSLGREKVQNAQTYPGNSNTADVVANAADTYLAGSQLPIGTRLQASAGFKWRFRMTKTAAGVAAATFNIRTGTAGTTADASRCLFTWGAQTAVVDDGYIDLEANFRAPGASAVLNGVMRYEHTGASVGLDSTLAANIGKRLVTLSSAFDATPAGTIIGVSCNPGASGVWTFQLVSIEAYGLLV